MEGVYDSDLVNRYSVNETSLSAIGCTSQSEAHRRGHRAILSNAKDGTVSFGVGLEHPIRDISTRATGRKLKLPEDMIRIKFQMAEGFIDGCLAMLDVELEMGS
ncbi:hypothetical protein SY86_09485 [Erwinia tracheiphila]|uniref:Uncharacterized protein n=1 Tax=Erwinia tracheiphila TaxID=65700 RepID=A0A0M2KF78_9GAMM|nr:putative Gp 21 [Erwinia tracheiphila PSU-1]KKF35606.1 hypothetical protein SY86_09485 [Erwinia tracheiphila]